MNSQTRHQENFLQYGPTGSQRPGSPFTSRQLARLDEALTLSSRESGLTFSVYVGALDAPPACARRAAVRAAQPVRRPARGVAGPARAMHIVTGEESAKRLPNRACALAALTMRASFSNGDLTGGIVNGLRMLADSAGHV